MAQEITRLEEDLSRVEAERESARAALTRERVENRHRRPRARDPGSPIEKSAGPWDWRLDHLGRTTKGLTALFDDLIAS